MGIITLKIDDDTEEKLRRRAGRSRGAARGVISASVEDAIKLWLKAEPEHDARRSTYAARKNGAKIAEAGSLSELSARLRELGINPRDVIIESIPPGGWDQKNATQDKNTCRLSVRPPKNVEICRFDSDDRSVNKESTFGRRRAKQPKSSNGSS